MLKIFLNPRLFLAFFAVFGAVLVCAMLFLAPVQAPVVLYKLALVILAGIAGVFFDTAVFPYSLPSSYLIEDWRKEPDADRPWDADYPVVQEYRTIFIMAFVRRALLIAAFVLAVSLGL